MTRQDYVSVANENGSKTENVYAASENAPEMENVYAASENAQEMEENVYAASENAPEMENVYAASENAQEMENECVGNECEDYAYASTSEYVCGGCVNVVYENAVPNRLDSQSMGMHPMQNRQMWYS